MTNRAIALVALMGVLAIGAPAACGSSTSTRLSGSSAGGSGGDDTNGVVVGVGPTTSASGAGGGCANACNDGLLCTVDTCNAGACEHTPMTCPEAQICDVVKGCIPAMACSSTAQCQAALGSDACKTDILCDPAQSICTYKALDKDNDGYPPVVCGGTDCNDGDPTIHPGAVETCDGKDNDCNGLVDDGATCPGGTACMAGACSCPAADKCSGVCVDLTTDHDHCGTCDNVCAQAATCVESTCVCGPNTTQCNGQCVDTTSDDANCGICNKLCPADSNCQASACVCQGSLQLCGGACADVETDPTNCGFCGKSCGNESCVNGVCSNVLFTFSGVKQNLPIASLTGWTQCYLDNYGVTQTLATITAACTQANMLLACRVSGSPTLTLAAEAARTDVMFDTGTGNVTHDVNGVSWYFNDAWSWGFAPQGDPVMRNKCDETASSLVPAGVDGALRLCWHTITLGSITPGWRCGSVDSILDATYDRMIFQAP